MIIALESFSEPHIMPRWSSSLLRFLPSKQPRQSHCRFWKVGHDDRGGIFYADCVTQAQRQDSNVAIAHIQEADASLYLWQLRYSDIRHVYFALMHSLEAVDAVIGYYAWWDKRQDDLFHRPVEIKIFLKNPNMALQVVAVIATFFPDLLPDYSLTQRPDCSILAS